MIFIPSKLISGTNINRTLSTNKKNPTFTIANNITVKKKKNLKAVSGIKYYLEKILSP